jgi:hypothetical protein
MYLLRRVLMIAPVGSPFVYPVLFLRRVLLIGWLSRRGCCVLYELQILARWETSEENSGAEVFHIWLKGEEDVKAFEYVRKVWTAVQTNGPFPSREGWQ